MLSKAQNIVDCLFIHSSIVVCKCNILLELDHIVCNRPPLVIVHVSAMGGDMSCIGMA